MPSRCVLNGLMVEPVPSELESLDPLSKQIIQRTKAFQAVYRLGTYTGKVPSHTSVKACKGTMFFFPLPLDKTMDTVEEIEDMAKGKLALLPNPELYIIVNSKSKNKKTIWQSPVSLDKLKAAVRKLKATNWLYVNVDESSLDEASRYVVETVSQATSTMLEKVSNNQVSSYQSYTVRQLNSKQSNLPDTEHYNLVDVKEDPLSNKFKYLDVLCFPTLFPTGRFGESHPRQQHNSPSEFVKSHLMNKDGRFRKEDQHVFYLLWQKELRELASGIHNLLKGTRQHPMLVREFVDNVAKNEEHIEASLSTVFQNMHGSNQYWYQRRSEVFCMVREYGSLSLFLTLSCAEYNSLEISTYLREVNNVSDSYPTARLCTDDPISVLRKFSQKFHDFFKTVIMKVRYLVKCLTTYKKEYQARGAPHYHILLWIEGAPVAGADDDEVVLQWIQERITCRIPEPTTDPELHQLVTKYLYHKCNKYSQRKKRVKAEDVCVYDFVAEYTKSGVDEDGNMVYCKLGKPILPNHKLYNPNKEDERGNFFYSLLLLFVPFRDEGDLIEEGETAESAFEWHMQENEALNTHSEKLQRMLRARETVQKINEARQAQEENV